MDIIRIILFLTAIILFAFGVFCIMNNSNKYI